MLSGHNHMPGCSGKLRRRWRLICCGLHRCDKSSATISPSAGNGFETSPVMAGSSYGRVAVGVERAVNTGSGRVAAQLRRDRRRRPPQPARDLSDAQTRVSKARELNPLVLRQEPRADLAHGQPFEGRHEADQLSASIDLVAPRPVVGRRAGDANLTGCASDAPPPLAQAHELLTLGRQRTPPRPLLHTTRRRQHNLTISEVLRPSLETTGAALAYFSRAVDNLAQV